MKHIALSSNTSWYLYNFRASTITALTGIGYEVVCFAPEDEYSDRLRALGVRFVPVPLTTDGTRPLQEVMSIWHMFWLLRRSRPDYLFNFTVKMNIYFGLCAYLLRIPFSNNVSGLGTVFLHESFLHRQVRRLYGWVNRRARRVFFQNIEDRDLFNDEQMALGERVVLLPGSGIDMQRFAYTPMLSQSPFTFLMMARLIADKGVREFVQAARVIRDRHPNTRFVIIGPEAVRNRSAISNAEVTDWRNAGDIELPGPQDDVLPWLNDCHVLVLPSYREGMPRSVLEAAAVGRPAIVSDVPGCRQSIVPNQTGWLCRPRDAASLVSVMETVLSQAEGNPVWLEEFGRRASERAQAEFSDAKVVQAYLATLRSAG